MESLNTGIHANAMETSCQGDLLIIGVQKKEGGHYLGKKNILFTVAHGQKHLSHLDLGLSYMHLS